MNRYQVLVVLLVFCNFIHLCEGMKALESKSSINIESIVGEPSGITFCHSTNSLWIIDDSFNAISETNFKGQLINKWEFQKKHHKDVEAVTCDDKNQKIYIALESNMDIISFILPRLNNNETFTQSENGSLQLIELDRIHIDIEVCFFKLFKS